MRPIGHVESPYKERFGTPRQAVVTNYTMGGVAQEGTIVLRRDFPYKEALRDLEGFSHLWIIWHAHLNHGWKAMVTPPRGPKGQRFGLFATRAPHRPNQIGLSALEIVHVRKVDACAAGRHEEMPEAYVSLDLVGRPWDQANSVARAARPN